MGAAQARRNRITRRTPTRLSIAISNESDDVKRWTARRKATAVMDILRVSRHIPLVSQCGFR